MNQIKSIPILRLKETLIVSIQVDLHDRMAEQLQTDILEAIKRTGAKGVLIDISVLEMVDSFIGRTLADTASMANVEGARVIICGMRPPIAITLVELGLSLGKVETALDLDEGYEILEESYKDPLPVDMEP